MEHNRSRWCRKFLHHPRLQR